MATQIVILNKDTITVDDEFIINWADKGKNWVDAWCPDNFHAVIWNDLVGQNEIQTKDPATGNMTGNTDLNATSDAIGTTTIADLLVWGETRRLQMEEAYESFRAEGEGAEGTESEGKNWPDYDPNYS